MNLFAKTLLGLIVLLVPLNSQEQYTTLTPQLQTEERYYAETGPIPAAVQTTTVQTNLQNNQLYSPQTEYPNINLTPYQDYNAVYVPPSVPSVDPTPISFVQPQSQQPIIPILPVSSSSTEGYQSTTTQVNPSNPNQVIVHTEQVHQNPKTGQVMTSNSISVNSLFTYKNQLSVILLAIVMAMLAN